MWRLPRNVGTHAFTHKSGWAGRVHLCRRVLAPALGNAWDLSRAAAVVMGQEGFATYSCRRGTVVWILCSWACELHMSPGCRVLVGPGSCPEMAFLGVCCKACLCSCPPSPLLVQGLLARTNSIRSPRTQPSWTGRQRSCIMTG